MNDRRVCLTSLVVCILAGQAWGQGFLVLRKPHPMPPVPVPVPTRYDVTEYQVDADISDQIARVHVRQTFHNPGSRALEVEYFFSLPEDGAVDNFVLTVDGREMPGRILGREEARRIYEDIVRRRQDPALLEFMGRGLFRTSVFPVPPGKDCQVSLSYTQVLRREGNLMAFAFPFGNRQDRGSVAGPVVIKGRIRHATPVKSVYSPSHTVDVKRPSDHVAEFSSSQAQMTGDFRLLYSMADQDVGLSVVSYRPNASEPGYFLLLASPKIAVGDDAVLPKTVVFVLDKSGSMTGKKIEQAKNSLRFVLKNLNAEDTFNIVTYDDSITTFKPELQACNSATITEAVQFVERISAGGSTNIDGALRTAMDMLTVEQRPTYVVFLTDGLPTAGEQRVPAIVQNCRKSNRVRARLMAFGLGDDVNARLLDKLVAGNFGTSHYVRPNEDIEGPVSRLYSKLSAPVLSDVALDIPGLDNALTYPKVLPDVFRGGQIIVIGRYHQSGPLTVTLRGRRGSTVHTFNQDAVLDADRALYAHAFIEKMWAERRIGYLIDEIDLNGPNAELTAEIVQLSKRHGILTPYTSFLADENVDLAQETVLHGLASDHLKRMESAQTGRSGVAQRAYKGKLKSMAAPSSASIAGTAVAYDMEGRARKVKTVSVMGNKTFFRRGQRWLDSTVTPEQEKSARRVQRFSDDYFKIVSRLPASQNQYFTLDGEILLTIDGNTLLIVPQE